MKKRRARLTDRQMLDAAKRRLAEHMILRPATTEEALQIAARHRARATALRVRAAMIRTDAFNLHRIERDHGLIQALQRREADLLELDASKEISHAEAWESVAAAPEGQAYRDTLRHLHQRVQYYERLISD